MVGTQDCLPFAPLPADTHRPPSLIHSGLSAFNPVATQVYDSLSSGTWDYSVQAVDAAGNVGAAVPASSWTLALGSYVQITSSVPSFVHT